MLFKFFLFVAVFFLILRFVARFFLQKLIKQSQNNGAFDPFRNQRNQSKNRSKPNFDQIQDADFEDVTKKDHES